MSLFGSSYPKLQNSGGTIDILLPYSYLEPEWTEPNEVEQYYLDGTREYLPITVEDHASIKITVHLFKYGNQTAQRNKFKEVYAYNHQNVRVFPNSDGASLRDKNGNPALFHITKIGLYWLSKPQDLDTMVIYLKSLTPIDLDNQL